MKMQQLGDAESVEPCDICGDVGFPEVIAACSKCKVARAHVYCMQIFVKIVPDNWVCESCHSGNDKIAPKYVGNKTFSRDLGLDASDRTERENTDSTSPYKMHNSGWQACSKSQKVVGTGKVKFIPEEEAIRLSCSKLSSKTSLANSSMHKTCKTYGQSKKVVAEVPSPKVKPNSSLLPMGHGKLPRHSGVQKNSMTNQRVPHSLSKDRSRQHDWRERSPSSIRPVNKEETSRANALEANDKAPSSTRASSLTISTAVAVETPNQQVEKHTKKEPCAALQAGKSSPVVDSAVVETLDWQVEKHTEKAPCAAIQAGQSSPVVGSGLFCASGEYNRSNVEERDLWSIQMNFKLYRCCLPSRRATWRGGFKFIQSSALCEFYDGLEAQPPCTVHRKAYNFSCKLPSVLEVDPLPMSSLLADLFQNDCPGLQDVALFFFPSDNSERSRQNLNHVFEFLDGKNSMFRSFIDGVELLVFTSKQLNEDSRGTIERVYAKYFLWGLFRRMKDDRAIERLPDAEAVDMDIDMVGEKDVLGRIDTVQNRKDKPENFSINSEEGTLLQNTAEKVEDKKTIITSSDLNLNVQDKISSSTDLRKNIKTEFPFDLFPLNSIEDYHKIMDTKDAPPGFEGVHELGDLQPSIKLKRIYDLY